MFAPELKSVALRRVLEDRQPPPVDLLAVFPTGNIASTKGCAFADYLESFLPPKSYSRCNATHLKLTLARFP